MTFAENGSSCDINMLQQNQNKMYKTEVYVGDMQKVTAKAARIINGDITLAAL